MIIHQMLGTRISDTLTLQTDCLYDSGGETIIRIRHWSVSVSEIRVPSIWCMIIALAICSSSFTVPAFSLCSSLSEYTLNSG